MDASRDKHHWQQKKTLITSLFNSVAISLMNQAAIICLLQFLNFCHKLQHYAPQPQNLALPQYLDNQNQALFSQIYLCQIPIGEALCVCKWLLRNLQRPSNVPNYHKNVHRKINAWILELKIREKDSITIKTPYSVSPNTSPTYRHESIDNFHFFMIFVYMISRIYNLDDFFKFKSLNYARAKTNVKEEAYSCIYTQ